jgi:hypothetical protein
MSKMRWACGVGALLLGLAADAAIVDAHAAEPEVGTIVLAKPTVLGIHGPEERQLKAGLRVHRNELVRTGPQAQAELRLDDNTKLALGPDAELRLDEFAVSPGSGASSIAVQLLKGTLRFLTGRQTSESYKIETPSATIGVRGTVFDIYIGPEGDTFVLLHQGEVQICSRSRSCRAHRSVGRLIRTTPLGVVSEPMKWTASLVRGVNVRQAFPFVGRTLTIDPVRRLSHKSISSGVRVLDDGGKAIDRTLRKISPF